MLTRQTLVLSCVLAQFAGACRQPRPKNGQLTPRGSPDTVMVFVASDSMPMADSTQVADSSRRTADGSIVPDSAAPACDVSALPDTTAWTRLSAPLSFAHLENVSIRLPEGFAKRDFGEAQRGPVTEVSSAEWDRRDPRRPHIFPDELHLWVGDRSGYATGRIVGQARQTSLTECRLSASAGTISIILYTIEWGKRSFGTRAESVETPLGTHEVVATWQISPKLYARVNADAHDSTTQRMFVAALRTVRFEFR
jgi:hypothetical protein